MMLRYGIDKKETCHVIIMQTSWPYAHLCNNEEIQFSIQLFPSSTQNQVLPAWKSFFANLKKKKKKSWLIFSATWNI